MAKKFSVVGVDTFDGDRWPEAEFDTEQEAIDHAKKRVEGKQMMKMHVYDEDGKRIAQFGTY